MMRFFFFLSLFLLAAQAQDDFYLENGDTVVMYDDSITAIVPSPYDDVTRAPGFEGGYNAVLLR
jgi:hypothetical protein